MSRVEWLGEQTAAGVLERSFVLRLPRDGQFELFDALAGADKRLIARPGPHAAAHPDDEASWQEFIRTGIRLPDIMSACRSRTSRESTAADRT